ncbi:MAG: HAMP domain-containing sensor histidine kinase [bacterium]|nr:HAMP domain-containing sensor histidine kinase [bacterium]
MGAVKKIKQYCLALLALLLIAAGIFAVYIKKNETSKIDVAKVRLQVNQYQQQVRKALSGETAKESLLKETKELPFLKEVMVIGLDGTVVFSDGEAPYKQGEQYPLDELSGVEKEQVVNGVYSYRAPIVIEGKMTEVLLLTVETKEFRSSNKEEKMYFLAVMLLFLVIAFLLLYEQYRLKKDLFEPVEYLHEATRQILNGTYDKPLHYSYSDEIGSLCKDFEYMRSELEKSNREQERMATKEKELLACISHDLKTPLSGILGYVEGIGNGIVTSKEDIKGYCDIIIRKVKLQEKLIDDILEETKTELNQMTFEMETVYSKEFFDSAVEEMSLEVREKHMSLTVEPFPQYLITIDRKRMMQVLYNLINNAVKYSNEKGTIHIRSFLNEQASPKELVITVEDNGKGISAVDLPFIFDKFYRGEKARTQDIPGSGLGLNIAKYIIEKHGGHMECDSILGEGTTMMFSIPLK